LHIIIIGIPRDLARLDERLVSDPPSRSAALLGADDQELGDDPVTVLAQLADG